jgi:acyl-coenzyme A thioesterase PaaI-like protein
MRPGRLYLIDTSALARIGHTRVSEVVTGIIADQAAGGTGCSPPTAIVCGVAPSRVAAALSVPLQHALGARLIDDTDPAAGVTFPVTGLATNGAGSLHAGALAGVLELAGYLAVLPTLGPHEHAVTHAVATQLADAAPEGSDVVVSATVDRRTRHLAFVSVTATCGKSVVARAQLTKSVVRLPTETGATEPELR